MRVFVAAEPPVYEALLSLRRKQPEWLRGAIEPVLVPLRPEFSRFPSSVEQFQYLSPAMYMRLQLPRILGSVEKMLLYLDSDTLCMAPFECYPDEVVRGQKTIGAAINSYAPTWWSKGPLPGTSESQANLPYFNSGVLAINTESWMAEAVEDRVLEYLETNRTRLKLPDQDGLNVVLQNNWQLLPDTWNYQMHWAWDDCGFPRIPGIAHFCGSPKVWEAGFPQGPRRELYLGALRGVIQ